MLITSSVAIPIEIKEPSEAVLHFVDILRQKVSNLEKINITLGIVAMTYPDILVSLAEHLPETVDGFGLDRSVTAGQFIEACNAGQVPKPSACTCDITDYLSVSDSLALIESFFNESMRAVRSTSFTLFAKNIRWKGDNNDGSGKLDLFDLKSFGRKKRFSMTATYRCWGQDAKDPRVKEALSKIAKRTDIAFDKGVITEGADPEIIEQLSSDQLLAVQKCFDEAFEETGREIRQKNLDWGKLPGLAPEHESFDRRMESVMTGKKERVNFPSMVRRFMKETFFDFKPMKYEGEQLFFTKSISQEIELVMGYDRIHMMGFGKAFTLLLGVNFINGPLARQRFDKNLFDLFQQRMPPCWTYVTEDDLLKVLNGISIFLEKILNSFEKKLVKYLCPVPSSLPNSIVNRGAITVKQVLSEAIHISHEWSSDAALYCITSSGELRLREAGMGPMIDVHGLLKPHGSWCFIFYSSFKKKALITKIPSIGSISCQEFDFGSQSFGSSGQSVLPDPIDNWIDSDKAMAIAEENGGHDAREEAYNCWDIIIKLEMSPDPSIAVETFRREHSENTPEVMQKMIENHIHTCFAQQKQNGLLWIVQYLMNKSKNARGDVTISFDAISGKNVKVSPF